MKSDIEDRDYQREVLQVLFEAQAKGARLDDSQGEDKLANTLQYLMDHELVIGSMQQLSIGGWGFGDFRITARGSDYMLGEDGLSAILNVQTIKIHEETLRNLRQLLADALNESNVNDHEKSLLKRAIESASDEGVRALAKTAIAAAAPALLSAIHTLAL